MNRIYKVIWSKTKHCYVVVSELAKRHTKGGSAGGCRMMTARVLSTLLLGAYLVGGCSLPSAWAADIEADKITAGSIDVGGGLITAENGLITAQGIIVGDVNAAAGTITAGSLNVVGAGGRINTETGEFSEYSNGYGIDFDEILSDFTEMPFIGHIPISKAFEEWQDYFENPDEAEIYGFELDDGEVQMAILDCFIKEPDENQPLGE